METSPQNAGLVTDETTASVVAHSAGDVAEAESHIHMPNPSYWPILLSLAIAIVIGGFLLSPLISLVAAVFVLISIMGWALEDPMVPLKEKYVFAPQPASRIVDHWKFKLGQNVVDAQGKWLGKVQARFPRSILVERGRLLPKVFYVPQSAIRDQVKNNTIFLTLTEDDLLRLGLNRLPDDLYLEEQEAGIPIVRGAPQFARRPLSPAETGHYNYGRMSPGINTDATGSYHREEIQPKPQTYVTEDFYSTDKLIPPRPINPD